MFVVKKPKATTNKEAKIKLNEPLEIAGIITAAPIAEINKP